VKPAVEPVYEIFGARLRKARLDRGMSLPDVVKRIGFTRARGTLWAIELGKQRISLHVALELAAAVGIDIAELTRPSEKREAWDNLGDEP
jgi:transcriptional regulator with XRE-family HTH domain